MKYWFTLTAFCLGSLLSLSANFVHDKKVLGAVHLYLHALDVLDQALFSQGYHKLEAARRFDSDIRKLLPKKYLKVEKTPELFESLYEELMSARSIDFKEFSAGEAYDVLSAAFNELPWDAVYSRVEYDPADVLNRINLILEQYVFSRPDYKYAKKSLSLLANARKASSKQDRAIFAHKYNEMMKAYLSEAFTYTSPDFFLETNLMPLLSSDESLYDEQLASARGYWEGKVDKISIGTVPLIKFEETLKKLQRVYEKMPRKKKVFLSDNARKAITLGLTCAAITLLAVYGFVSR